MKFTKYLLLLFSLLFIGEISAQVPKIVAGINVDRVKRLEKFVQSEIDKGNIPGAVTMIIHNGQVVHQGALGYKNVATKAPMTTDDSVDDQAYHIHRIYDVVRRRLFQTRRSRIEIPTRIQKLSCS
jgi:CubicO group peptidase (beta-lactamase class C family)